MKTVSPSRPALPPPLAKFLDELAADHAFGDEAVAPLRAAAAALDREADDSPDAANLLQGLSLICAQDRPVRDRFEDVARVVGLRGQVTITLPRPA